jgi:NAD(P)-dependent dehydrogenase (short-subunit alcohol dehydrogenase family)
MSLAGRTGIVTGAGSGIGRAMVDLFLAAGVRVIAADNRGERLDSLPEGAIKVEADVSTAAGADRIIGAAGDRLDILCNNAGVLDRMLLVDQVTEEDWNRVIAVNLTGPFLLCNRALPMMVRQGAGVIINTASLSGIRGGRAGAAYTASKFGLVGLTQNIAATYGSRGIRCNAICPGAVVTDILGSAELGPDAERIRNRDREKPPPVQPDRIAHVALFLATDESSYMNGAVIPVDGGAAAF